MPFKKAIQAVAQAAKNAPAGANSPRRGFGRLAGAISEALTKSGQTKAAQPRRGMGMVADLVAQKVLKGNAMKKGGMVKKSSDAMGRAVKRKTADVKGRAMKKGK